MNLAPLLLGGLLIAGLVATDDDHLAALMKKLHHSSTTPDCPLAGEAEVAPLGILHEALGRLALDESRRKELHERLMTHAPVVHEAVAQSVSARDAQTRALFAAPFDAAALDQTSQSLATAQLALAKATADLHAALRAALTDAERAAFDAARDALLSETETRHADFRRLLDSGALDAKSHHGH